MAAAHDRARSRRDPLLYQQSILAVARLWGLSLRTGYAIQAVAALSAVLALVWLWTGNHSYRLKAAALVVCGLLATPYLFDYDLTLLGVAIAWLAIEGSERGFLPFEKSALALAWLAPIADRNVAKHALIPMSPLLNIVLLVFIILAARFAKRQARRIGATGFHPRETPPRRWPSATY